MTLYTSHKSTILGPTHTNLCFILASILLRVRSFMVICGHSSIFAVGRNFVSIATVTDRGHKIEIAGAPASLSTGDAVNSFHRDTFPLVVTAHARSNTLPSVLSAVCIAQN